MFFALISLKLDDLNSKYFEIAYVTCVIERGLLRKRKILQEERSKRTRRTRVLGGREGQKPIIYNIDVRKEFFHRFNEKCNLKTIKRIQNLETDFFRENPFYLEHITY